MKKSTKRPCKLVLGGGAARGLAHIGVIDVIRESYDIRAIVGTSMGAIIGGLYACGYSPHEMHGMLDDLNGRDLMSFLDIKPQFAGLLSGENILEWLDDITGQANIEDLRVPYAAIAYDLKTRRTVIIDRGRLSWAMRASSSLPFMFAPLQWEDYELVDGGAEHPLPIEFSNLFGEPAPVIAVNVLPPTPNVPVTLNMHSEGKLSTSKRNMLNVALTWTTDNQHYLATKAVMHADADLIINAYHEDLNEADFLEFDKIIDVGRKAAKRAIQEQTPYDMARGVVMGYIRKLKELKR